MIVDDSKTNQVGPPPVHAESRLGTLRLKIHPPGPKSAALKWLRTLDV